MKYNTPKVTRLDNGAWQVSGIVNGRREVLAFFAHSKREAIADFIAAIAHKKYS